ncbi:MAG TPA: hypothetical protein DEB06_06485 [Phycisphaerales bacterium]|nr:hypothetical protein [Phycisphaerales bacterium]
MGGRMIFFEINAPGQYDQVYWGHWGGTTVVASTRNSASDTLVLNLAESDFAAGVAVWSGQSEIELDRGGGFMFEAIDVRCVITVTADHIPVRLATGSTAGVPPSMLLADILGEGAFEVNIRFEARNPNNQEFDPILDLFQSLPTRVGALVRTSFSAGFYYDPKADCPGNANGDGVVDFDDLSVVLAHWQNDYSPGTGPGDTNADGIVDFNDITTVLASWLRVCP